MRVKQRKRNIIYVTHESLRTRGKKMSRERCPCNHHVCQEWWALDVGAALVSGIEKGIGHMEAIPGFIVLGDLGVDPHETWPG